MQLAVEVVHLMLDCKRLLGHDLYGHLPPRCCMFCLVDTAPTPSLNQLLHLVVLQFQAQVVPRLQGLEIVLVH
jgi:hypothetical protein